MSSNATTPSEGESVPCCEIQFLIQQSANQNNTIKVECPANYVISGLKEEYESDFGIPAEQQDWFYGGIKLRDEATLMDVLDITTDNAEQIIVKQRH